MTRIRTHIVALVHSSVPGRESGSVPVTYQRRPRHAWRKNPETKNVTLSGLVLTTISWQVLTGRATPVWATCMCIPGQLTSGSSQVCVHKPHSVWFHQDGKKTQSGSVRGVPVIGQVLSNHWFLMHPSIAWFDSSWDASAQQVATWEDCQIKLSWGSFFTSAVLSDQIDAVFWQAFCSCNATCRTAGNCLFRQQSHCCTVKLAAASCH